MANISIDRTRQVMLVALGAVLIVFLILDWKYVTDAATFFVENLWCAAVEGAQTCRFRGYQHFLTWIVIAIANMAIAGFVLTWIAGRLRRWIPAVFWI